MEHPSSGNVPMLKLPQFLSHRTFSSKKLGSRYDMILGRDILQKIGLNVLNLNKQFEWNGILVDMIPQGQLVMDAESNIWSIQGGSGARGNACKVENKLETKVSPYSTRLSETYSQVKILDANYEKVDLVDVVTDQKHLSKEERKLLLEKLQENVKTLRCERGKWVGRKISFKLKPGTVPYSAKPY